jgi:hypothetical protein
MYINVLYGRQPVPANVHSASREELAAGCRFGGTPFDALMEGESAPDEIVRRTAPKA